jgi:hypothetical protein
MLAICQWQQLDENGKTYSPSRVLENKPGKALVFFCLLSKDTRTGIERVDLVVRMEGQLMFVSHQKQGKEIAFKAIPDYLTPVSLFILPSPSDKLQAQELTP